MNKINFVSLTDFIYYIVNNGVKREDIKIEKSILMGTLTISFELKEGNDRLFLKRSMVKTKIDSYIISNITFEQSKKKLKAIIIFGKL